MNLDELERLAKKRESSWFGSALPTIEVEVPTVLALVARVRTSEECLRNLVFCGYHDLGVDYVELQVDEDDVLEARKWLESLPPSPPPPDDPDPSLRGSQRLETANPEPPALPEREGGEG